MKIGAFANLFAPMVPAADLQACAKELDRLGADSLWFGEHVLLFDQMEFGYPGSADGRLPVPEGHGAPDQAAVIGFLASQTEQLRFGTGISLIPQRNPVYTAKEFATLDWLSGGRIDLGVGVGWCKEEVLACGYEWDNRGARCDEALSLMTKLWTQPVTDHQGTHFNVQGARLDPKPTQDPLPFIIGGFSPSAMRRTARFGQGWLGFGTDPKTTGLLLKQLDPALEAEGRTRKDLQICMMPAAVDDETVEAYAELGVDRLLPMIPLTSKPDAENAIRRIESLISSYA